MTTSAARVPSLAASAPSRAAVASATWYIATILACAAGIVVGLIWDISWHMTVGRDTLFTAPHNLEYASASIAGLLSGGVVLFTTFRGSDAEKAATVRYWGFRGPMGGWITIWGSLAMAISAPFDDWWHNAYGLDVKIISPPHLVLLAGMLGILIGALTLAASVQNRSAEHDVTGEASRDAWGYAFAGGVLVFILACATLEYSWPNLQHATRYYQVWAAVFPMALVGYARAGKLRWPATAAALVFMVLWFAMAQILRNVDAIPKLAPINNPRTYMWPPYFPAWLIVPAFGIDLIRPRVEKLNAWLASACYAIVFVALFAAVQYPFSSFMMTDASRHWLFNGHEWPYTARMGPFMNKFWMNGERAGQLPPVSSFFVGLGIAAIWGTFSSRLGLAWGGWMSRVKR